RAAQAAQLDAPVTSPEVELEPASDELDPVRQGNAPEPAPAHHHHAGPPTSLPLGLLATLEATDPAQSRATIRDDDSGVIASYRPGDHIREGVRVVSIDNGVVELLNDERVERLGVSEIPVELSADDVFYPDLLEDLYRSGSMDDAIPLPPGPEYTVKAEAYAWGTPRTIAQLRSAIRAYARGRSVPRVHIGDISLRQGGPFPPHLSHQQGRDVDIAYVLNGRRARFGVANRLSLDLERTWALLQSLLDTEAVLYVFIDYEVQALLYEHARAQGVSEARLDSLFQYPHGRQAARGIIRHWKGHDDHFHVRFVP
ncbi:MAG: penicillin-insensitive murein endopeptidase, partial [Nannocystaceae bacterium]